MNQHYSTFIVRLRSAVSSPLTIGRPRKTLLRSPAPASTGSASRFRSTCACLRNRRWLTVQVRALPERAVHDRSVLLLRLLLMAQVNGRSCSRPSSGRASTAFASISTCTRARARKMATITRDATPTCAERPAGVTHAWTDGQLLAGALAGFLVLQTDPSRATWASRTHRGSSTI